MSNIITPNGTVDQEALRKAAKDKKIKDFAADLSDVYMKHKMTLQPVLKVLKDGLMASFEVQDIPPEEIKKLEEQRDKK